MYADLAIVPDSGVLGNLKFHMEGYAVTRQVAANQGFDIDSVISRTNVNKRLLVVTILMIVTCARAGTQDQIQRRIEIPQFKTIMALLQQDRPAEAEQLLDQAEWRSSEESFDIGDSRIPTYAFYSPPLVRTYVRVNDHAKAERLAKDGVNWSEQRYGAASLQVGSFLEALADVYRLHGKYAEAEPLYARSLSIHRLCKFDDCLLAEQSYGGLSEAYLAMKHADDALQLLRPTIEKCLDKSRKADLLNVYAIALEDGKRPEEASKAAEEADRIGFLVPRFQQENRDLLRARLLAFQGRFEEAGALCRKWIATFEVPDGAQSDRKLMIPLEQYKHILRNAGRHKEAAEVGHV